MRSARSNAPQQTSTGTAPSRDADLQHEIQKAMDDYQKLIVEVNKEMGRIPEQFLIVGGKKKESHPEDLEKVLEEIKSLNSGLTTKLAELKKADSTRQALQKTASEKSTNALLNARIKNELRQYRESAKELNALTSEGIPRLADQASQLDILQHANQLIQLTVANAQAAHDLKMEQEALKVLRAALGIMKDEGTKASVEEIIANSHLQYMEAGNDQERATVLHEVNEKVAVRVGSLITASAAARLHSKTPDAPGPGAETKGKQPITESWSDTESDTESLSDEEIAMRMQELADFIESKRNAKRQ
jgi:bacterioferritin (cytochrome b1)